jgi:hypothetical protein
MEYIQQNDRFTNYFIPEINRWVNARWMSRELLKIGMTCQEWYDKYILKISSELERPKCLHCGAYSKFRNISKGYSSYCNSRCFGTIQNPITGSSDTVKKVRSNTMKNLNISNWTDEEYRKRKSLQISDRMNNPSKSIKSHAGRNRGDLLSRASNRKVLEAYFYVIVYKSCYKIGVSLSSPLKRIGSDFEIMGELASSYLIYKSSVIEVADFEYNFKIKNTDELYCNEGAGFTERFKIDSFHKLLESINISSLVRI